MASEKPSRSARIGSIEVGLGVEGETPASRASAIQAVKVGDVADAGIGRSVDPVAGGSSRTAAASAGVAGVAGGRSRRRRACRPPRGLAQSVGDVAGTRADVRAMRIAATLDRTAAGAIAAGSAPVASATRRVSAVNSMVFRNPISLGASVGVSTRSASGASAARRPSSVTSSREMRALSALVDDRSRAACPA